MPIPNMMGMMGGGPPGVGGPPPMPGGGGPPGGPSGMPGMPPRPPGPPPVPPPGPGGLASQGADPQKTQMLMSMLAGIGMQNILSTLSKFMKTATTVGVRQEKPVRIQDGMSGPGDQMASKGMPANTAGLMPLIGAAMQGQGAPPVAPPGFGGGGGM